jgi:natural product precursor
MEEENRQASQREKDFMNKMKKLVLSQETLRNLTTSELQNVVGGSSPLHSACTCPTTTQPLSCIECNPPQK